MWKCTLCHHIKRKSSNHGDLISHLRRMHTKEFVATCHGIKAALLMRQSTLTFAPNRMPFAESFHGWIRMIVFGDLSFARIGSPIYREAIR